MSFTNNASRFAFLVDDAPDPFETVKKKGKSKNGVTDQKTKQNSQNTNSKKKTNKSADTAKALQSMTFGGGPSEGKKKKAVTNVKREASSDSCNGREEAQGTRPVVRPEGVTDAQWQEWQKRDLDYVSGTYESDLEAALMQSKIDYQEQKCAKAEAQKAKIKKKPIPVSLTDFNAKLNEGSSFMNKHSSNNGSSTVQNGFGPSYEPNEEMLAKYREEALKEIEREKQVAFQRQLLDSRNQLVPPLMPAQSSAGEEELKLIIQEKELMIAKLSNENLALCNEAETLKSRFKKLCNVLGDAQLKEKAILVTEVEKISKLNTDLNEQVNLLHSQLEQERSRSHAALIEYRKLVEQTRRRTNTDGSQ